MKPVGVWLQTPFGNSCVVPLGDVEWGNSRAPCQRLPNVFFMTGFQLSDQRTKELPNTNVPVSNVFDTLWSFEFPKRALDPTTSAVSFGPPQCKPRSRRSARDRIRKKLWRSGAMKLDWGFNGRIWRCPVTWMSSLLRSWMTIVLSPGS